MQFNPHLGLTRFIGRREGRRVPGRTPQEMLYCTLGPVLDMSAGGMRVLSTKPWSGSFDVELKGSDVALTVRVKVAWVHRLGFRRHEIGLSFVDVDDEVSTILSRISAAHRLRAAV
jgi:hypothetical protein